MQSDYEYIAAIEEFHELYNNAGWEFEYSVLRMVRTNVPYIAKHLWLCLRGMLGYSLCDDVLTRVMMWRDTNTPCAALFWIGTDDDALSGEIAEMLNFYLRKANSRIVDKHIIYSIMDLSSVLARDITAMYFFKYLDKEDKKYYIKKEEDMDEEPVDIDEED